MARYDNTYSAVELEACERLAATFRAVAEAEGLSDRFRPARGEGARVPASGPHAALAAPHVRLAARGSR
jgi:hypothetical protein